MTRLHSKLLLTTVASLALAASVQAQTLIPGTPGPNDGDTAVHGTGATSIQNVIVQEMNCIAGANPLGTATGTTTAITEPTITTPAGAFNCATAALQSGFNGKYVGTGSGFGRQAWRSVTSQFSPVTTNVNPFGTWNRVQFAFADSSIVPSDIVAYRAAVQPVAGLPIMFPKFVLPVAIAYNPVYGKNSAGAEMRFNVNPAVTDSATTTINGVNVGGMRLSRAIYCGIFNGTITNFNNAAFAVQNGSQTLQDPTNDTGARWSSDGVPIRLVGRLDKSGTTDVFSRALAAQCTGLTGITNHYLQNSEILPYDSTTGVNFSAERSDTGLQPNGGTAAGTTNLIGKEWFNPANGGSIQVSANSAAGAPSSAPVGNAGSGRYLVANGSGAVRDAINFAPDYALNGATLNGKIGYISADFIANSPTGSATLFAAAVTNGTTGFALPSAAKATAAVNAIVPPVSTADGVFNGSAATRMVRDQTTGAAVVESRDNPLAWYDVLYPTATTGLANPSVGYALTGTTQVLANTCYLPANSQFIVNLLGWNTDAVTHDAGNGDRTGIFTTNLLPNSNIGALPPAWKHAITETFLTDSAEVDPVSGTRLGSLNLWIRSQPTPGGTANSSANGCGGGKTGI